jgi:hypothetical protein
MSLYLGDGPASTDRWVAWAAALLGLATFWLVRAAF